MSDPSRLRPDAAPLVRFEAVSKHFGGTPAVDGVTLDIHEGEFFALLGPSGCGKTTLLRMLAGFETPGEGRILLDGVDIVGVPPHRRAVNMMFQSYALFPHLTAAGNIGFGLKQEGLAKAEIATRVDEMLTLVRLQGLGDRKPHQLSGGQRQRVALGRALVKRPRVFLLDEPLAALDRKLREETRFELKELQARLGLTFVIVTHDQDEAMSMADRIAVMNQGALVQLAPPRHIYRQPATRWIAGFIGAVTLIEGRLVSSGPDGVTIETASGMMQVAQVVDAPPGATVWLALRPEHISIAAMDGESCDNMVAGTVRDIAFLGDSSIAQVALDDGTIMKAALTSVAANLRRGERVRLSWPPDAGVVLIR